MPRPRGSEIPQRQSNRGPPRLRTSSSDSNSVHSRSITPRTPTLGDRRSPKSVQSDLPNQKKLGTRIADLESQLGQAQEELKNLKEQLASAKASEKDAPEELEKQTDKKHPPTEIQEFNKKDGKDPDVVPEENNQQETDVFEVPVEPKGRHTDEEEQETKPDISNNPPTVLEAEEPSSDRIIYKDEAFKLLKAKLEEKEKELEVFCRENERLQKHLTEATSEISLARSKEEEMTLKLIQLGEELEASKANETQLNKRLEASIGAKEELESEMKKMRVQTEQWRKAADAAASFLAGDVDIKGRRVSERCGSMDKHIGSIFEPPSGGGYAGFLGSPGMADGLDEGFGNGNRKGSGIKMFGDLWKKKGHK